MPARSVLITGANGQLGHYLIDSIPSDFQIYTLDRRYLDPKLVKRVHLSVQGDISDPEFVHSFFDHHHIDVVIHLAAVLSAAGEADPAVAHRINADGTFYLLHSSAAQAASENRLVRFIFPSTIAVYGLPDRDTKIYTGAVRETDFLDPHSMYGCTKLYSEHVGSYISNHRHTDTAGLSFIALRFPTIISPTLHDQPGTGDFAAHMIHAAATGQSCSCFVRPDSRIPFLAIPDAVKALTMAADLNAPELSQNIYNLSGFSASAADFASHLKRFYPHFDPQYDPDPLKQKLVDSWPEDLDDLPARQDWDWRPDYDLKRTLADLLLPALDPDFSY